MNAPDPFEGQKHQMRGDGTVGRRGTAYVVGSWDHVRHSDPSLALAEYMERVAVRRGARFGGHAIDVTRAADLLLHDRGLPLLVGTECVSWEQLVHAGEGSGDEYRIAWHNPADPFDAARGYLEADHGTRERIAYATRGRFHNVPTASGYVRIRVPERQPDTVADVIATLRRVRIARPNVKRPQPRYVMASRRARASDPVDPMKRIHAVQRAWRKAAHPLSTADPRLVPLMLRTYSALVARLPQHVRCVTFTDDPERLHHGVSTIARGKRAKTKARDEQRAAVKRERIAQREQFATVDELRERIAQLAPGERLAWTLVDENGTEHAHGTFARSEGTQRYSARITTPRGTRTRSSLRSVDYAANAVRNAIR